MKWIHSQLGGFILLLAAFALLITSAQVESNALIMLALACLVLTFVHVIWNLTRPTPIKKVYVAGCVDQWPKARRLMVALRKGGFEITHDWTEGIYNGKYNPGQAQSPTEMESIAHNDLIGVRGADALVLILPGARGSHTEMGVALGLGIPVILLQLSGSAGKDAKGRECVFYHAPRVRRAEDATTIIKMLSEGVR